MLSRANSITAILLTAFSTYIGFAWYWPLFNASPTPTSAAHTYSAATNRHPAPHHTTYSKSPNRESPFATYNNPGYRLSFRYPRTFSLTEDREDFGDDSSLKSQDQLSAGQPGLLLLASVEIPDDAYPNTTFSSGHLQFAVNPTLSEPACRALAEPASEADFAKAFAEPDFQATADEPEAGENPVNHERTGVEDIHARIFHWRQSHILLNHMDYLSRDYFAYSNNTCYEFFLQVSATVPLDPDPVIKPADNPKILRTLEKTVSTFQVRSKP
jgi:hypothetical protein